MEVPERMLNCIFPTAGDQAAIMFKPGAVTSGCKDQKLNNEKEERVKQSIIEFNIVKTVSSIREIKSLLR